MPDKNQSGDRLIKLLQQRGVEITAVQRYSQAPTVSGLCNFSGFGRISRNKLLESQLDAQEIQ